MHFYRRFTLCLLTLVVLATSVSAFAQATFNDTRFTQEVAVQMAPYYPIGFAWAPDGRMFVWHKSGVVRIVKNGQVLSTPFIDISNHVNSAVDRGLIGLALDPNFSQNGYVYLAYVYENLGNTSSSDPRTERVTRVQADPNNPDVAIASSETAILGKVSTAPCVEPPDGSDCMPNDMGAHTIDHLAFGPDGKLYVSVGEGSTYKIDNSNAFRAQNLKSLNGKILRINSDGTAPGDNPWDDGTNSNRSKIYSMGLRNPFRFSIDSATGKVYVGDVGWFRYEEVDYGRGKNFGWPCYEGNNPEPEYQTDFSAQCALVPASSVTLPQYTYGRDVGSTVTMGPVYRASVYPTEYQSRAFFADYSSDWIQSAAVNTDGTLSDVKFFATGITAPVYMALGPDGSLYYSSLSNGAIMRIKYNNAAKAPVAQAAVSPSNGYSPLTVQFSSAGSSDPNGGSLTYSWDFGDGSTSTSANPAHTYTYTGVKTFNAVLTVKNTANLSTAATVKVTVGSTAPTATITSPANGTVLKIGQTVTFTGTGTDQDDGTLSGNSLHWTILLHHNAHYHVYPDAFGSSGSFVVEDHGTFDKYSYVITLTVTDSSGLTDSATIELPVDNSACTLNTADPSVTICFPANGSTVTSPVKVGVGTTDSAASVTNLTVLLDNQQVYSANTSNFVSNISMPSGMHNMTVVATDSQGRKFQSSETITVSGGGGCALSSVNPSVTICSPANGATVSSPVNIVAGTTSSSTVTAMAIYVDNTLAYKGSVSQLNQNVAMAAGSHRVVVQAWNNAGQVFNSAENITVSGSTTGPCTLSTVNPSVTICSPANGATVASPVNIVAGTTSSSTVSAMAIYVDNTLAYKGNVSQLNQSLTMAAGSHFIVVQAWNTAGQVFKASETITVSGGTSGGCALNTATSPNVNICTPTQGSTVASPVAVSASAYSTNPIAAMKIYVDGTQMYSINNVNQINTSVALAGGNHLLVVQAWDSTGAVFNSSRNITVSGSTTACTASSTSPSVTICSPTNGSTVASPVHVVAKTTSATPIVAIKIYVDNVEKYSINNVNAIDTSLAMTSGKHFVVVQAWNSGGAVFNSSTTITVSP